MTLVARIALTAALIGAAGAAGFFAYRLQAPDRTTSRAAVPHSETFPGDEDAPPSGALVVLPASGAKSEIATAEKQLPRAKVGEIPERLPDFTLTGRDGVPHKLSEWDDRPLIVNFWATWCAPCRREIPLLKSLRQRYSGDGFEVVGVAVDFRDAVLKYAQEIGIDYPLLIGEQDGLEAVEAFGMDMVFPFTVFADRQRRIVAVKIGELHTNEADFILGQVRDIDAGRLALPTAQRQIAVKLQELAVERARSAPSSGTRSPEAP